MEKSSLEWRCSMHGLSRIVGKQTEARQKPGRILLKASEGTWACQHSNLSFSTFRMEIYFSVVLDLFNFVRVVLGT